MSAKNIEAVYSLSPMQEGMLFHSLYAPDSGVYCTQFDCALEGQMDEAAFARAWQKVVDRHSILRTAFVWEGLDKPVQVVGKKVKVPIEVLDWRDIPGGEQEEKLASLREDDRLRGFKLSKAPLMRLTLIRISELSHHLVWTHHHLLLDGWSLPLLLKEVFAFYHALSSGGDLSLPPCRPYKDYIAWLQQQDKAKAESYWRNKLAGFRTSTSLQFDLGSAAASRDENHRDLSVHLGKETSAALTHFARRNQLTLNTILQGAWAISLSRSSGDDDVLYGVVVAGRPPDLPGADSMLGLFINTLPVRVSVDDSLTVAEWLGQMQQDQAEMRQFEYSPLVQVQTWSEVEKGLPLFESIFAFENYPVSSPSQNGNSSLTVKSLHTVQNTSYPLALAAGPGEEIWLRLTYDENRFDSSSVERMIRHFRNALEKIAIDPSIRLGELNLLSDQERIESVVSWNETSTGYPKHKNIPELVQEQVERTPDAVAVCFEDQQLTYAELNRRANRLAHYLRSLGVGSESPVAIYLDRSIEMVAALLGTLKAGGFYLPLDSSYPKSRVAFMLADANVSVLLSQQSLLGALPETDAGIICLDSDWDTAEVCAEQDPVPAANPENLAYVIYTSGSTAQPKGVSVSHCAVARLVLDTDYVALGESDIVAQASNSSFDAATFEIWGALMNGAKLVIVTKDLAISPRDFASLLAEQRITTLFLTTALFNQVAAHAPEGFSGLSYLLFGGEAVDPKWVKQVLNESAPRNLLHVYGPTEGTTFSTWQLVDTVDDRARTVPIGMPIANTQAYVLDRNFHPATVGISGELYIGGDGLARGYVNRPELTAEKFLPNPFGEPGSRIYKTGDLTRRQSHGSIEFIGRNDYQVKLRGFRVELGEIESVLLQHPEIAEAIVVARRDTSGEKRIVAYCVSASRPEPAVHSLRAHLKETLPDYMVPAAFVMLESLPLTPNGKVDRAALPVPERLRPELCAGYVAARSPVEEIVGGIWTQALGVDHIGIHDNFFELGGHSLLATQVVSRLRETFKIELPLRTLFESPTVAALSSVVETLLAQGEALQAPPIRPISGDVEIPLSFAQQRLWFIDQLESGSASYNVPAAVRVTGVLNTAVLEQCFNEIVRRHDSLRTAFANIGGRAVQVISPESGFVPRLVDLSGLSGREREEQSLRVAIESAKRPFDLTAGPLLTVTLIRSDVEEHVVAVCMHHIISDGWSMGVFVNELASLFDALAIGEPSPLAELAVQYADFAVWQRGWLRGEIIEKHLDYWKRQLSPKLQPLDLPADRPRPPVQTYRGAHLAFTLPPSVSDSLATLVRSEGVTMFMTLLAGFKALLFKYTSHERITVGSPIANRNRGEIEPLIGFFVNTLVLKADLSGSMTYRELLRQVREASIGAYTHQDLPFEKLVDELQPERDLSRSPLFQVMFILQNAPMQKLDLKQVTMSPIEIESHSSKFDLTLSMRETLDGLIGAWEYNTDLFNEATINRMSSHLEQLLEYVLDNPDARLFDVEIMSAAERNQILFEWNRSEKSWARSQCVHELFEAQANKTPDTTALVSLDGELTYYELNRRAGRVADYLSRAGVGPETPVGICIGRSSAMIIAMLGVMKAGGAYVALDPAYPQERIAFMVTDSRMPIVLTEEKFAAGLDGSGAQTFCLDSDSIALERSDVVEEQSDEIKEQSDEIAEQRREIDGARQAVPGNSAYIIYTSGSTGLPKGVVIKHESAVTFLNWVHEVFSPEELDGVLASTSICFDLSVFEVFGPLSWGGTVVLAENALELPSLAMATRVKLINTVPSAMNELVRTKGVPASVTTVNLAGEALQRGLVEQIYAVNTIQRVYNLYGPSEDTTYSTFALIQSGSNDAPLIGKPVANTRTYIVGNRNAPTSTGIPGELLIGGQGLARGYYNRPALTAERFIPDPFSGDAGSRLYRTGDLARFLADGNIDYMGRIDHQVKVRGFRIELGEIETVLAGYAGVRDSVVTAHEDRSGKRIVAYVAAEDGTALSTPELRSYLRTKLPDYMVPSIFVLLDSLPLTPNGKIDRKALPSPDGMRPDLKREYVAPHSREEKLLAEIWSKVLGLDRVGVHDNFFELGGDSIQSIQVITEANQLGLRLTPKQLFQHQSISELALVAGSTAAIVADQGLVTGPVVLTPVQRWLLDQNLTEPHHFNQALMFQTPESLDPAVLGMVVTRLIEHHDAVRLRFRVEEGEWRQSNAAPDDSQSFEVVNLTGLADAEKAAALEKHAASVQASFDLERGPLFKVVLFNLGASEPDRVLIVAHHLLIDGVSWRILLDDFQTLYSQFSEQVTPALPAKTTSFKDWAGKLLSYAQSAQIEQELDYWLSQRQTEADALPVDAVGGINTEDSAGSVAGSLDAAVTRSLLHQAPEAYHTQINDLLLTALVEAFRKWTGSRQVFVDLEGHGREELFEDADVSRTVGWFTTIFPVELCIDELAGPAEALKSVKEQLRAIPNKGIGYGLLKHLGSDPEVRAKLASSRQPEVSFNYLGQVDQVLTEESVFRAASESSGPAQGPANLRSHLLDISAIVAGGRLQVTWTFSSAIHRRSTITRLAESYIDALRALVEHCLSPEAGGFIPSDFPLAGLDQEKIDQMFAANRLIQDVYALSPGQEGMLFHSLYAPDSGVYCTQLSSKLNGRIDLSLFERAWQRVIDRHSILRTGFIWEGLERPVQVVHKRATLPLEQHDWRAIPQSDQEKMLDDVRNEERRRGFKLSEPPLMRLILLRLADDCCQLIWTHHHLLLDGWSVPLLLQEVAACYQAYIQGKEPELQAARSYKEYVAWLERRDLGAAESYWRKRLEGFTATTPIPIGRSAAVHSETAASHAEGQLRLGKQTTAALSKVARQHQLTLNTIVQASWALLLSRYSGEQDVVYGGVVSGRPPELPGIDKMVGMFINTLPVRVRVDDEMPVAEWLRLFQEEQVELRRYEYSPLIQVQGWSQVGRGVPLFESIFVFENYPVAPSTDTASGSFNIDNISSLEKVNYPLLVVAAPGEELTLKVAYNTSRYADDSIRRLLDHMVMLLEGIAAEPERKIWSLDPLTGDEKHQLLVEWNSTRDYSPYACIQERFEIQAAAMPDRIAAVCNEQQLTYEDLNTASNRIAHFLRAQGVGPEDRVALFVERSLEMVIGILGILKSGAAYLPLDLEYPKERLAFMLDDARAPVVLTQHQLLDSLPACTSRVVCLDADQEEICGYSANNPKNLGTPENIAYVIYTSGSTGNPKGVMISHSAVIRLFGATDHWYGFGPADVWTMFHSFAFDMSVWELWGSLLIGGKLVVVPYLVSRSPGEFNQLLREEAVTVLNQTPSGFRQIVQANHEAIIPSLRCVTFGGEPLQFASLRPWFELYGDVTPQLVNMYGITETTVHSTYRPVTLADAVEDSGSFVGCPIPDLRIHLLDDRQRSVPIGVTGEIYVGGAGLARGYSNRPELTAARFIPDPFSAEPGRRLYRSGDLARRISNGDIECLGRIDHQVKIRGFRIETGEIEIVLLEHPAVKQAFVMAREDTPGDKRLVAYLVIDQSLAPTIGEARRFLKDKLPEYMVPSAFVVLDSLPLTTNGKTDRRALPPPEGIGLQVERAYVAPRTPVEEALAAIWQQILHIEQVGAEDHFFELGGHSLLATQLVSRVFEAFQVELPLPAVFEKPTVAGLAEIIEEIMVQQMESLSDEEAEEMLKTDH